MPRRTMPIAIIDLNKENRLGRLGKLSSNDLHVRKPGNDVQADLLFAAPR